LKYGIPDDTKEKKQQRKMDGSSNSNAIMEV
jgi:hypothetical protein